MIKIVRVSYRRDYIVEIDFSDGSAGEFDLGPLLQRDTELTRPLLDGVYFRRFFLDIGALCWPNGLELSPAAIHADILKRGVLRPASRVA